MLKAICQFIEDNTTFSRAAGTIQSGWRPLDSPDRCILVAESGGGALYFDLPDRTDKMIQILARGESENYWDPRDDSYEVYDFLHGSSGWELPEVIIGEKFQAMVIEAVAPPQYLGIDDKGRHEFSTNYIWKIRSRD